MYEIRKVRARQVYDSRGNPTVEVEISTAKGRGRAIVPSGASTGSHEALELRDGGNAWRGKGVSRAVDNVNKVIGPPLIGKDCTDQQAVDKLMLDLDGTSNKSKLGANAILGCSMAAARCAADSSEISLYKYLSETHNYVLPVPAMNVINGGAHAGNRLDIQEHMVMPTGAKSFEEACRMCSEIYHSLRTILTRHHGPAAINVGDEGGFAPPMKNYQAPFQVIELAIEECGYKGKVEMACDAAASGFYRDKKYHVEGRTYSSAEFVDFYKGLADTFPLASIEDAFAEDDWKGFALLTKELGKDVQIVGDDLFVTNAKRLEKGFREKACNALLLKVNQIGTLTESFAAAKTASRHKYGVMVSHRSGETEDPFIADLSVALACGQIKAGAPCRGERTAKYNQLLRIEEELSANCTYAGRGFRRPGKK